jgi:hypothetical protein
MGLLNIVYSGRTIPKGDYKFAHELVKTPTTKAPQFQVKYKTARAGKTVLPQPIYNVANVVTEQPMPALITTTPTSTSPTTFTPPQSTWYDKFVDTFYPIQGPSLSSVTDSTPRNDITPRQNVVDPQLSRPVSFAQPPPIDTTSTSTSPITNRLNATDIATSPIAEVDTLFNHPDFYKTMVGIDAYQKEQLQKALEAQTASQKASLEAMAMERDEANVTRDFTKNFYDTFLYGKFAVPIEMQEELSLLWQNGVQRAEFSINDGKKVLRDDSEFNRSLYEALDSWLTRAAQAGLQRRTMGIEDFTDKVQQYIQQYEQNIEDIYRKKMSGVGGKGMRKKGGLFKTVSKKSNRPSDVISNAIAAATTTQSSPMNVQYDRGTVPARPPLAPPVTPMKRQGESARPPLAPPVTPMKRQGELSLATLPPPPKRQDKKPGPLRIRTNVLRRRGPRAPTRPDFPRIDTSNVTSANILD